MRPKTLHYTSPKLTYPEKSLVCNLLLYSNLVLYFFHRARQNFKRIKQQTYIICTNELFWNVCLGWILKRCPLLWRYRQVLKKVSCCIVAVFAESLEARCWVENEDVVGAAPTGDAPTTSEWSTIVLQSKVWLILEILRYVLLCRQFTYAVWFVGKWFFCLKRKRQILNWYSGSIWYNLLLRYITFGFEDIKTKES